jgi:hypothetical protein
MEENKKNLINLSGKINYTFNFDIEILKKFTSRIFLTVILLHLIIINSSSNYYQTEQVAIKTPTIQTKKCSDAPSKRQKSSIIPQRRKKRRRVC